MSYKGPQPNIPHLKTYYAGITKKRPALYGHQFIVQFMGGGNINGIDLTTLSPQLRALFTSEQMFSYYAQGADIPQATLNKATTNYFAGKFHVPTVRTWDHTWNTQIILDQDLFMYHVMREWMELMSSYRFNGGGYRVLPDVNLRIKVLDSTHQHFTTSFVLCGVWPKDVSQIQLQYQDSAQVNQLPVSFSYQYSFEDPDLDNTLSADPLKA